MQKRLLQVTTIPDTLEAFMLPLVARFRELGWAVDGAAARASANAACVRAFDELFDVRFSRNPLHPSNLAALRDLRRVLRQGSYDLVHVHTPVAAFLTRYVARREAPSAAVVYTAHGFHFYEGGNPALNTVFAAAERRAGRWTDALVVLNGDDLTAASKHEIVPDEVVTLVPGVGFDIDGFRAAARGAPPERELRASIGVGPSERVLLMVAEFTPNKRQADAVAALSLMRETNARLVFVGVGDERDRVERAAAEVGVADRVTFLGYRRDVPQLLTVADALLLLSKREGLPRSVMEAMALGVPVVGTDIRGVRDLLGEGAGVLVPVGQPRFVAEAIDGLLADAKAAEGITAAARERVERYGLASILGSYEVVYERALARARERNGLT